MLFVIFTLCTHPFIPKSEIKTEVGVELLVVQSMVSCANDHVKREYFSEKLGVNLSVQMIDDTG